MNDDVWTLRGLISAHTTPTSNSERHATEALDRLEKLEARLAKAQKDSERLEIKAAYAERDAAMIDVLGLTDGFPYSLQQVHAFRQAIDAATEQPTPDDRDESIKPDAVIREP